MIRTLHWLVAFFFSVCVLSFVSSQEGKKYSIKTASNPVPKDVNEAIQKLLVDSSVQLLDSTGKPICDVWFRKDLPAEATPDVPAGVEMTRPLVGETWPEPPLPLPASKSVSHRL